MRIVVNQRGVLESSSLETDSLTASSGTKLQGGELHTGTTLEDRPLALVSLS